MKKLLWKIWLFCLPGIFLLAANRSSALTPVAKVSGGRLERFENFGSGPVIRKTVEVWLPESYNGRKKFDVLYMHDGQMLFDSATTWNRQEWGVDETMGRLMAQKKIRNCIVVAIWNDGMKRFAEYFPKKVYDLIPLPDSKRLLQERSTGRTPSVFTDSILSDDYLKFIVRELKPMIDRKYRTRPSRSHTFVAGSSMGGLISLYAICEYPKVFGGAACISTHWPGLFRTEDNPVPAAMMKYLASHLPAPAGHRLYFDYGNLTLDAMYKPYQLQADEIIKTKGYKSTNWITKEYPGADHSERSWNKRFMDPMLFLLGR